MSFENKENAPERKTSRSYSTLVVQGYVDIIDSKLKQRVVVSRSRWSLDDFDIGKPLGRGNFTWISSGVGMEVILSSFSGKFGKVYLAREKKTKYIVALKVWKIVRGRGVVFTVDRLVSPLSLRSTSGLG